MLTKVIHKQALDEASANTPVQIYTAHNAPIVMMAMQHGGLQFWYEQTEGDIVERRFLVRGTGHPIEEPATWRASTMTEGGHFVFHLYEIPVPKES